MKKNLKMTALTLSFSIVALVVSVYSGVNSYQLKANLLGSENNQEFNVKIENGIEAYIKKQQEKMQQPPAPAEPIEVSVDDDPVKGDENAKVTIIEFSEYQCPFCKRYVDGAFVQIKEKYIDTGKVKYVFRDFPLGFHENAKPAAIAAECVREQGGDEAYWKYHDKLFENQSAIDSNNLKDYAAEFGYNITECLDKEKYAAEVDADTEDGKKYGVSGTPAFFINGRKLVGAQPFENFEAIIEEELAK